MGKIEVVRGLPGAFGGMAELEKEPPVTWLIKDWLAAREISCIYGQGGTFKSYIALGWTLQLSLYKNVHTLYVAAEGTSGLRSRVDAWMAAHGRLGEYMKTWHYYNANVHVDDHNSVGLWLNAMEEYFRSKRGEFSIKADSPRLIVVDTMARNFQGDENSAKEVGMFIEGCEHLRRELDTSILIIHHMGVTTGRERGTAALRNATFAMFKTSNPKHNGMGGGSVELTCDRMKDATMPEEVRCYFDTVDLDVNSVGEVHRRSQAMRNFPPRGAKRPRKTPIKAQREE